MKSNLLEIVRDILNDIDGDFVDNVFDTEESQQVAQIVKSTYQAIISNRNWPHTAKAITLIPYSDSNLPTYMSLNSEIKEMISIYYDIRKNDETRLNYKLVKYLSPDAFLRFTNARNSDDVNTLIINDPSGIKLLISDNKGPQYYTSFNDVDIVFDSYDAAVDSTLQSSKVQARAYIIPTFEISNDFIPDLPDEAFSALIEEAKSKAAFKLNKTQDIKAEQEASRQQRWLSRKAWRTHEPDIYPNNYGRRRGSYKREPTFRRD